MLAGVPIVLFRCASGAAAALVDRCPHRGAPLSAGRQRGDLIECGYHGWSFDRDGHCQRVPGLAAEATSPGRRAQRLESVEQDSLVWVHAPFDALPGGPPPRPRLLGADGYASARKQMVFEAALPDLAENILDVPHTAFLHRGLFRGRRKPIAVEVVVRRSTGAVEARYRGEPRPPGLLGRLLAPGGGVVEHVDRFLAPAIAEVEYRVGEDSHLLATSFLSPESATRTRLHAVVCWRTPVWAPLVRAVATPIATRVLEQDRRMLARIAANDAHFPGAIRVSTELDVLGAHIRELTRPGAEAHVERESERALTVWI